jgi:hypothetical protein
VTSSPPNRFRLVDYEAILEAAQAQGYTFARFTDPAPSARAVYLRHDVDNSLESAVKMAELEAQHDAVATYLVLVRSPNYNVFSGAGARALRRLRELGHEVGLHFTAEEHDPSALAADLPACIRGDAQLLERVMSAPVRVFSFHNPAGKDDYAAEVPGLVNTYEDRFLLRYLSESNMSWRHGSPVEVLAEAQDPIVQILVHPFSYRADLTSDREVLLWFLRDKVTELLELNVAQNRVLREEELGLEDVAAFLLERRA